MAFSSDKATEIARQICAGLAAAHERGVIHRDLKPANIMLDGAGKIRITDFGLAGIAATIKGAEVRAGTPAYMAPEQLAGHDVSTKSDIYSLGLILYEILTGKRVFEATTLPELMKQRESGAITNPSTLVRDLDPLIERVILRCLENDPDKRPATSLQVAAALPGGDPLAAALAAGETPSPQMVAAAGENTGLKPRTAILCLAAAVVGVVLYFAISLRENGLQYVHLENSPEVLSKKSREIISALGYPNPAADRADGFSYDHDYLTHLEKSRPSPQWDRTLSEQPPVIRYWYRQSPRELSPDLFWGLTYTPGVVSFSDPPATTSGMINLQLDPAGRLVTFEAIPPEKEEKPQPASPVDWKPLFTAAGLDMTQFHSTESTWESLAAPDTRAAWDGVWPGSGRPLHVEAAARRGKFVYFSLTGPWSKPKRMTPEAKTRGDKTGQIIGLIIALTVVGAALFLAYRNYSRGKVDRQGAFRLAIVVFATEVLTCLFRSHFIPTMSTIAIAIFGISTAMFVATFMWILYLALEPYVRRNWPQTIISWSRLLGGNFRDPLVGRDVLFGVILGITWDFVIGLSGYFHTRAGDEPLFANTELLLGFRETIADGFVNVVASIQTTLVFFLVLFLLRALVKNRWVAALLFVLLFTIPRILGSDHYYIDAPMFAAIYGIAAISLVRFGLITLAVGVFTADVIANVPVSLDFSNWYAARALAVILSFIVLAAWGFYISLAGQHLWKDELFE
jgi:serine/threonine protein kinase